MEGVPDFGRKLPKWKRAAYVVAGSISFGLGILGIPLPLLPTTPFLLLAAYCYARGSERFYRWLIDHPTFGSYIRNYRDHGGTTLRVKTASISLLWITIGISATFAVESWWVRVILLVIAVGVSIHILSLKTLKNK